MTEINRKILIEALKLLRKGIDMIQGIVSKG